MRHWSEEEMVLHFYGDESEDSAHLSECDECRVRCQEIAQFLQGLDEMPAPARPPGYAAEVWRRLEPRLTAPPPIRPKWQRLVWSGAIAAALVVAFAAGWMLSRRNVPVVTQAPALVRDRILLVTVGDHLERSRMVLVELANAPAQADISSEREFAQDLLAANRLYRQTAADTGEGAVESLLEDLERVLLEIARSPERISAVDLEELRGRIESQGILFKIRVVESELRSRVPTAQQEGGSEL